MIPLGKGQGVLVEMDNQFNLSLKAKQEERKKGSSDTENSMANAETEDDELSFLKGNIRNGQKKHNKKIIFTQNSNVTENENAYV